MVVSFTKKKSELHHDYIVNDKVILRFETVKDLGVTFGSKLSFREHINEIVVSALQVLAFIFRKCKYFDIVFELKCITMQLCGPNLNIVH